jgi:hypothetical protein
VKRDCSLSVEETLSFKASENRDERLLALVEDSFNDKSEVQSAEGSFKVNDKLETSVLVQAEEKSRFSVKGQPESRSRSERQALSERCIAFMADKEHLRDSICALYSQKSANKQYQLVPYRKWQSPIAKETISEHGIESIDRKTASHHRELNQGAIEITDELSVKGTLFSKCD